jgi:hypothetical protein
VVRLVSVSLMCPTLYVRTIDEVPHYPEIVNFITLRLAYDPFRDACSGSVHTQAVLRNGLGRHFE